MVTTPRPSHSGPDCCSSLQWCAGNCARLWWSLEGMWWKSTAGLIGRGGRSQEWAIVQLTSKRTTYWLTRTTHTFQPFLWWPVFIWSVYTHSTFGTGSNKGKTTVLFASFIILHPFPRKALRRWCCMLKQGSSLTSVGFWKKQNCCDEEELREAYFKGLLVLKVL